MLLKEPSHLLHLQSVKLNAIRNRENGGISSMVLSLENAADSITYGATILKICAKISEGAPAGVI